MDRIDRAMRTEVKGMLRELEMEGKGTEGEELEREEGRWVEREKEIDRYFYSIFLNCVYHSITVK